MKIAGIDPKTLPNTEILVIPRGEHNVVFTARGIRNFDEFKALCPEPKPPMEMTPKGYEEVKDDPGYTASLSEWIKRQTAYIVVKSLEPSNIEWDTVKLDVPGTWANWREDLMAADFNNVECNLVFSLCWSANQLDENKLVKAREAFLRGQQQKASAT